MGAKTKKGGKKKKKKAEVFSLSARRKAR